MRILHLLNEGELSWQKTFADFVYGLCNYNVENVIGMPDNGYTYDFLNDYKIRLADKPAFNIIPIQFKGFFDPFSYFKLVNIIRNQKIDIVHSQLSRAALYAGMAKKLIKVKVVSSAQKVSSIKYFLNSDVVVACSKSVEKDFIKKGFSGNITQIYNGINFENYFPKKINKDRAKSRIGISSETFSIGIVARLSPMKGHRLLFESFRKIKDDYKDKAIVLVVVGDGELESELRQHAKNLKIEKDIIFLGRRDDLVELLCSFDLYISSSIEKEGLPTILIEALLMEVPVIATDIAGTNEIIINNKTGFLVNPDSESIYRSMKEFLNKFFNKDESIIKIKEEGRKHVIENFSLDKMVKSYYEIYKSLLR
ncbi:glycosyl transferase group 1 [Thermodesulfobium narugense DSM 14796]|uniref:Glycosyl transferase group 1 n=1 Tax=Thermodesulfobium narugense DSM 14796 TaxID=747365 RepID=M1E971_9BACT|nr:glycosyltransferase [Thermodesulfobium narugense]AEE14914.1 glycosyl transferase group 1 [Thermodesulfobium narugense DSM 14796]